MTVKRIVPDLKSRDPAASREFYGEVLGLEPVMDHGWIATFAAPGNSSAQLSLMSHDAGAQIARMSRSRSTTSTPPTPRRSGWVARSCTR